MSDSFTVPDSTVTGVTFYGWYDAGDPDIPSTVDWLITTIPFADPAGADTLASGTATLTAMLLSSNSFGYNIYKNSFSLSAPLSLTAGAY